MKAFSLLAADMEVSVKPYRYRVMVPKRSEAIDVLVPVCFSASHVAYSSLRMAPPYVIIGQAAGVAACLAIRKHAAAQDLDPVVQTGYWKRRAQPWTTIPALSAQRFFIALAK